MIRLIKANAKGVEKELEKVLNRSSFDEPEKLEAVQDILDNIQQNGDEAVLDYTARFDQAEFSAKEQLVSEAEIKEAYTKVDDEFLAALETAINNIKDFHERQTREGWMKTDEDGVILGQVFRPLEKVGLYVPGGTAAYPSSVLMNGVPAKVAGVEEVVMVSPPSETGEMNPYTLVAADKVGVDKIYKVGGAQAVGALAFGTKTIPKVDKIVGPGNIYVTLAKKLAYGYVDIDMLAGPSEVLVLADKTAVPRHVAADLLSQAEHDPMASSILVTDSKELANEVKVELEEQLAELSRKEIAGQAIEDYGAIILTKNLEESIEITNRFAAEHLEVAVDKPFEALGKIKNAGAIFLGHYTAEPIGDYIAGPNHVLPTGGSARFYSPLNIDDFVKKSSIISYSKEGLAKVKDKAIKLAEVEGLDAHANSVRVRFEE
ncbi:MULTISPECIES: histidinol dehydrogenase [unclassified Candidatus Frackibacter]|uniref:histidinol dehydrogenase n=1 Tax=unclassified Candidatus Frackibacter TaxID=2648818 RepID=UPI000885ED51|nr:MULTISPECIES: histidinol dehydrogenase [unclassified Candidatus Frackibacter]SDC51337.1 histidinol dehydrogenase [Candidatus Frackibacter sp. WG11]SEM40834.1 histidinol dehydrogenase [Candidatus Frackibacter sp. WG12]SFL75380.1 histidinol dehydrogenase [Candidatus Frackibacter sp. WG13]